MLNIKESPNKRSTLRLKIYLIILLVIIVGLYSFPQGYNKTSSWLRNTVGVGIGQIHFDDFHLGLDLVGGAHLVYEVDTRPVPPEENVNDAVEGVRNVIERRVNAFGVAEPVVQTNISGDAHRIIVELPGVTDVKAAIDSIGKTPLLEFKELGVAEPRALTADEKKQLEERNKVAREKVAKALAALKGKKPFADVAKEFSEDDASKANGGDIGLINDTYPVKEIIDWAKKHKKGDVTSAKAEEFAQGFFLLQHNGTQQAASEVKARHILICYKDAPNCTLSLTKEEALAKINELKALARPDNFAALATAHSSDGSAPQGGDLGWFGRGRMVAPFEEAAFGIQKGEISNVVETQFGYHLVYKEDEKVAPHHRLSLVYVKKWVEDDLREPASEWKNTQLGGAQLVRATVQFDPNTGLPQVGLQFNDQGKDLFAEITKRNLGKPVAIFLDGEIISQPTVQAEITNGEAVITGNFNIQESKTLVQELNAGALPLPVKLVGEQRVDASLGAESLRRSLEAALIGFALVSLFIILYYRLLGFLAFLALLVYSLVSLAIFKFIPVTMSVAGIAGFILSIGMAVDANVLIFERIKEERAAGKRLHEAIEEGFVRAWLSIRDSNVSTIITCVILFWLGTSAVRGFALTLAIGVLVSLFSAIFVTRIFVRFAVPKLDEHTHLVPGRPETQPEIAE